MMSDIRNPKLLYAKGFLFLLLGSIASAILIAEHGSLRFVFLLAIAVWAFARAYYFAFYVIEHYTDRKLRFRRTVVIRAVRVASTQTMRRTDELGSRQTQRRAVPLTVPVRQNAQQIAQA